MNRLTIIGNLTRDPELRVTQGGITVCSFTVAVNGRKSQAGTQDVDFFRVTAWQKLAEICDKYLGKGKKVCIVGSVSVSTYKGNDGSTRASLDVTATDVEFLSARTETQGSAPQEQNGYTEVTDDDLPF